MLKRVLEFVLFTVLFFTIPFFGAIYPIGALAVKYDDKVVALREENPRTLALIIHSTLALQIFISCAILYLVL